MSWFAYFGSRMNWGSAICAVSLDRGVLMPAGLKMWCIARTASCFVCPRRCVIANLDTREKRASSITISLYPMGPSIQAGSSGLDDEDRQIAGYGYSAISAAAAAAIAALRLLRGVGR